MKKRAIGFLLFLIPVLLALILSREGSPFGKHNSSFASTPKKAITKVEFSDRERRLVLEKKGEEWLLNGTLETRKNSILFLLDILTRIKVKSPVTSELFDSEITAKGIEPVRVRVSEEKRVLKRFLVYKTGSNTYGNIMKLRENSKPFIVYIPGYDREIGSAFTLNELFWQPHTVFTLPPSAISSVTLENFREPESSFALRNENGIFSLSDLNNELSGWDTSRVIRYLTYFTRISFESWALGLSDAEKEKISAAGPAYRLTVMTVSGDKISLTLWSRTVRENDVERSDSDRLWAKTEISNEFFIVRYFDIDPLLKKRSYFFPE